jgi:hydroxymethylpyrimidine pyrophosphatase-like HAD family hydrolase
MTLFETWLEGCFEPKTKIVYVRKDDGREYDRDALHKWFLMNEERKTKKDTQRSLFEIWCYLKGYDHKGHFVVTDSNGIDFLQNGDVVKLDFVMGAFPPEFEVVSSGRIVEILRKDWDKLQGVKYDSV